MEDILMSTICFYCDFDDSIGYNTDKGVVMYRGLVGKHVCTDCWITIPRDTINITQAKRYLDMKYGKKHGKKHG